MCLEKNLHPKSSMNFHKWSKHPQPPLCAPWALTWLCLSGYLLVETHSMCSLASGFFNSTLTFVRSMLKFRVVVAPTLWLLEHAIGWTHLTSFIGSTTDWPEPFLQVGFEPSKPPVLKERLKGGTPPPALCLGVIRVFLKNSISCCFPRFIQKQREVTVTSKRAPQERGPESGGLLLPWNQTLLAEFFLQGVSPSCAHVASVVSSGGNYRDASTLQWSPWHMSFYTSGSQWGHFTLQGTFHNGWRCLGLSQQRECFPSICSGLSQGGCQTSYSAQDSPWQWIIWPKMLQPRNHDLCQASTSLIKARTNSLPPAPAPAGLLLLSVINDASLMELLMYHMNVLSHAHPMVEQPGN